MLKKHLPSKRLYDTKQDTDAISVSYHNHTVLWQPLTLRMGQARHVVSARGDVDTRSTLVEPGFPSRDKKKSYANYFDDDDDDDRLHIAYS